MFSARPASSDTNPNGRQLTGGTGLERIGDESLTLVDSGFVHGYM
jgi:hypothetical protein